MNRDLRAHRVVVALLLSCSLLSTGEALAQTTLPQSPGLRLTQEPLRAPTLKAPKSPSFAVGLALGASTMGVGLLAASFEVAEASDDAGLALFVAGALACSVGPSVGHFYTGEYGRGLLTTGLRLGLYGAATGLIVAAGHEIYVEESDRGPRYLYAALGLAAAGFGLSIYDMIDAGASARRVNASQAALAPMIMGDRDGINGGGAMLSLSF